MRGVGVAALRVRGGPVPSQGGTHARAGKGGAGTERVAGTRRSLTRGRLGGLIPSGELVVEITTLGSLPGGRHPRAESHRWSAFDGSRSIALRCLRACLLYTSDAADDLLC